MYELSLIISNILSNLYYLVSPKVVTTEVITPGKIFKDPNGFVERDMKFIEQHAKKDIYKVGMSIEQVAYNQGQQDLIDFIKDKLIYKRG